MKHTLCFITILLGSLLDLYANNENDSLLKVLDKVISERLVYTEKKEATIKELKAKKKEQKTLDDMYRLNSEILHQYETFVCDSAEQYINENIEIAKKLDNKTYLLEGRLQLAFVYSLSGLFIQANDIFKSINCSDLPSHLQALYCWNRIRYYENRDGQTYLVEGNEALRIWIFKALDTERFRYTAYDSDYGSEIDTLIGAVNSSVILPELKRFIIEALMVNPYIEELSNFQFEQSGSGVRVEFDCTTVYGKDQITQSE